MSVLGNIVSAIFRLTTYSQAGLRPHGAFHDDVFISNAFRGIWRPPSRFRKPTYRGILEKLAANQTEKLDWKVSIVDLMKLLKLDSSLGERKKLAQELGYAGALDGSAEMNTWLHKQVMTKVAESGGRVPENLKT